jgi:hypothetical protein
MVVGVVSLLLCGAWVVRVVNKPSPRRPVAAKSVAKSRTTNRVPQRELTPVSPPAASADPVADVFNDEAAVERSPDVPQAIEPRTDDPPPSTPPTQPTPSILEPAVPKAKTPDPKPAGTQTPKKQEPAPTAPAPPAKREPQTLYQQVDVQRKPSFSIPGFPATTQNIHYQVLSRLDVELQEDGTKKVVQFVQDTKLIAADDLSRSTFAKSLEQLKRQQYVYTLNERGAVIEFRGHKDNRVALPIEMAAASGFQITSVIDEDGWRELAELTFLVPDPNPQSQESWQRQMTHDWGALGVWSGVTTFVRAESDGPLQEIRYKHDMKYTKPAPGAGGALPIKIVGANFMSTQAGGILHYDPQKQRVAAAQEAFDVQGAVTTELLGQAVELQMAEQQRIGIRVFDQMPSQ